MWVGGKAPQLFELQEVVLFRPSIETFNSAGFVPLSFPARRNLFWDGVHNFGLRARTESLSELYPKFIFEGQKKAPRDKHVQRVWASRVDFFWPSTFLGRVHNFVLRARTESFRELTFNSGFWQVSWMRSIKKRGTWASIDFRFLRPLIKSLKMDFPEISA